MNRRLLFLLLPVILCTVLSETVQSVASITQPETIVSSGVIEYSPAGPERIEKRICAYVSFNDSTASFVASHFDLVIADLDTVTIDQIKTLNPDIIILGYRDVMAMHTYYSDWAEVNSHEDWFLHDVNGSRLIRNSWGWYAMDVGNSGWRSHYAEYVKNKLQSHPFDGVFADDVWETLPAGDGWNPWTVPIQNVPVEIKQRWYNDMLGMIRFVKESIGGKLLIVNTSNNGDFVNACDGKNEEEFVHPSWYAPDDFSDAYIRWKDKVDSLKNISQSGKYYLASSGTVIPDNPTQADLEKAHGIMTYCLASYLLGVKGGNGNFGFNDINSKDGSRGYYSEFDVPLGYPINDYYSIGNIYARDFLNGKVLVNPTLSSSTLLLEENFKTLDGQVVSNITLGSHSGIILLRAG